MEKNKVLSMLGLARRAGKLSMGHDTALSAVLDYKAQMIIFAGDTSERLRKEFEVLMQKKKISIPVFVPDITISEILFRWLFFLLFILTFFFLFFKFWLCRVKIII